LEHRKETYKQVTSPWIIVEKHTNKLPPLGVS